MTRHSYSVFVVLFWLAAMGWLVVTKVAPPLLGGRAPDYSAPLSDAPNSPPPVGWRIAWDDKPIGYAVTRVRPAPGGFVEMRSLVHFDQLEIEKILQQLLGAFAKLLPSIGNDELRLDLTIATRLRFDQENTLRRLDTSLEVAGTPHVLNMRGDVREEGALDVVVFAGKHVPDSEESGERAIFRHQLELPRDALVGDAFAPKSELKNLEVGQSWTIPVYRPLPPNSPVQIVEARAERLELIYWNRKPVEVMVVAYRSEAGSGIGAARQPAGRVWVRPDGLVLRQEVTVSNFQLLFERLTEAEGAKYVTELEDAQFLGQLPEETSSSQRIPPQ